MTVSGIISALFPCASGEENQNREDLQPARQHIDDQNQLGKTAVGGIVAGGAHRFQAGADVIEAGQHRAEIRAHGEAVQRNDQKA